MTLKQQRIAIAEACGWKPETSGPSWHISDINIPDYPSDLNAMHEAEKMLQTVIGDISVADRMHRYAELLGNEINATASQRAEAFLRTIEKWE